VLMVLFYMVRLKCSAAFTKSSQLSKGDVGEVVVDDADDGDARVDSVALLSPPVVAIVLVEEEEEEADMELEANGTGSS